MKNESQYGLLLLQRYLYEHTDDQHPASVADILAFWQEHGIQAGRKSVYSVHARAGTHRVSVSRSAVSKAVTFLFMSVPPYRISRTMTELNTDSGTAMAANIPQNRPLSTGRRSVRSR